MDTLNGVALTLINMKENRINWPGGFSSIAAFIAMFICAPATAHSDALIKNKRGVVETRSEWETAPIRVEKLGDELFNPGTTQKLQLASIELMHKQDLLNTLLVMQAEHAFALVEKNVDAYLDWYYSLSGEYTRLYEMVTGGQLDNYVREKLIECLQSGKPFDGFELSLRDAISQNVALLQKHKATTQRILDQNRVKHDTKMLIVTRSSIDKIIHPSAHFDFKELRNRLLASRVSGTVAGSMTLVVTGKVMERVDSKNILKLATKTLAKFVISKTTGSLGGAGAGAAIGSAVPGVGTAVGAVLGMILGGVVIDKGLLELDQLMSREAFRNDIMGAIIDVRKDLMETMKPEPAIFFLKN